MLIRISYIENTATIIAMRFLKIFIVIFFSVVILYSFKFAYYQEANIVLSFDTKLLKDVPFEFFWTEDKSGSFAQKNALKTLVKQHEQHVEVSLPVENISRLRMDFGSAPGEVVISNVKLRSPRAEVIFDCRRIIPRNLEMRSKAPTCFRIHSLTGDPYVVFTQQFQLSKQSAFDSAVFFILLFLSLSLLSQIVRHIPQSFYQVDGCFLLCFFAVVVSAWMGINMSDASEEENRMLTSFPPLKKNNGQINLSFGKGFDNWFQDRFAGRESLITNYLNAISKINGYSEANNGIAYKSGWMFDKRWQASLVTRPSSSELKKIADNIRHLQRYCANINCELYILHCPIKEDVCREHNPYMYYGNESSNALLSDYIRKQLPDVNYIFPRDEMMKKTQESPSIYLWYLSDTHQSEDGAYVLYESLMSKIRDKFTHIPVVRPDDKCRVVFSPEVYAFEQVADATVRGNGNIAKYFPDYVAGTRPVYRHYVNEDSRVKKINGKTRFEFLFNNPTGQKKAIMIGDSYSAYVQEWLKYSFFELRRFRVNNNEGDELLKFARWENIISREKPDVLILCLAGHKIIDFLTQLY